MERFRCIPSPRRLRHRHTRKPVAFLLQLLRFAVLSLFPWSAFAGSENNTRVTGVAAGGDGCTLVAVGLSRQRLHYSILGGGFSGWSRGTPAVSDNKAELWLFDRRTSRLNLIITIPAPDDWRNSTSYAISPRLLPDGAIVITISGPPAGKEGFVESKHFLLRPPTPKLVSVPAWPEVSQAESNFIRTCTATVLYTANYTPQIAVGPSGGPWDVLLSLDQHRLQVLPSTSPSAAGPGR